MATLTFLGAAGTVTGSRFLVEDEDSRILVDCGLYQGLRDLRARNWEPLQVDAASLDAVVLTHAHLDHCGYLPRLVREGFNGPVVCTADTAALTAIVLRDSAHLQEEDAAYARRAGFSKHRPALPLYTSEDAEKALLLLQPVGFFEAVPLTDTMSATLRPAGHILGSATVVVEAGGSRLLFSGDLGRPSHPLLSPPEPPAAADVVVVESTYGDRVHPPADSDLFADAIRRTVRRGGTVLVPAFAVDRTEVVLAELQRLRHTGEIPELPVYVDSPMALAAVRVYRRALAEGRPDVRAGIEDPLEPEDFIEARDALESERLNEPGHPCIIVSASGMATGGRVLHHLKHQLPQAMNTVVLAGFQAAGTRGRDLLEGARYLKIHGVYVPVRAEIVDAQAFSCHADSDEIIDWLASAPTAPAAAYVVHGEAAASATLATRITDELDWCAVPPRPDERVLVAPS